MTDVPWYRAQRSALIDIPQVPESRICISKYVLIFYQSARPLKVWRIGKYVIYSLWTIGVMVHNCGLFVIGFDQPTMFVIIFRTHVNGVSTLAAV